MKTIIKLMAVAFIATIGTLSAQHGHDAKLDDFTSKKVLNLTLLAISKR